MYSRYVIPGNFVQVMSSKLLICRAIVFYLQDLGHIIGQLLREINDTFLQINPFTLKI